METAIVVMLTIIVVAVKGLTSVWIGQLTTQIREAESEEVDVLQRLEAVEATKLHLEREKQALERDQKLLENDRELVALDIQKLGHEPLPESSIDEVVEETKQEPSGAASSETSGAEVPEDAADLEEQQPSGRIRVLVVDDNQELRELLQQILSHHYDVAGAADGYEALTRMVRGKERYDVVVTDLKMPNVNGIALMQSLPEDVAVIVISGFLQREEFQKALEELSPFAVFEKPFKTAALREAVEAAATGQAPEVDAEQDHVGQELLRETPAAPEQAPSPEGG